MTGREKTLVDLHKQFLALNYKIAKYKMSGVKPPESLLKRFKDVERQMRLVSRALE